MSDIIEQWIELRANKALHGFLHNWTLDFEDKVVLAMIANREEMKSSRENVQTLGARIEAIEHFMEQNAPISNPT